ncbi:T9SS type A sorting domain-containing protein [candidate division WOR-3 bacterium]|nr:T9SS type A sorting domain-containing protein [candidate division WOR-3 bacterium]
MSRNVLRAIVVLGVIGFSLPVEAQRTNYFKFVVNGSPDTVMTQGDTMAWECDCELGDTLTAELWLDLNANHTIDAGDKLWIMSPFTLIDGMTDWDQGPADSSAVLDGIFYCDIGNVITGMAFAPGNYVFKVTNDIDASTAENWLLINPHPSPPAIVSGTVSIEGISAPDSLLNALWVCTDMDEEPWWSAITDSFGDYTLNLPDTGTWHVVVADDIPPYIRPGDTVLHVTAPVTGIDFEYELPEAYVYGDIKDDRDSLVIRTLHIGIEDEDTHEGVAQASTDSGRYFMGVLAGDNYRLGMGEEEVWPDYLIPEFWNQRFNVGVGDSIRKDIFLPRTDTSIFGLITENGGLPSKSYEMETSEDSVGHIEINSDPATGLFVISVSSIVDSYHLWFDEDELLPGFAIEGGNGWNAGLGDTVYVNLVTYKGSVSGSLSVDPGDPPVSDYTEFTVGVINPMTWETEVQSPVDSNGTYQVGAPEGTWNIELWGPEEWLPFPKRIESVTVDTVDVPGNDFMLNYGHCTLSGMLHGLFYVPEDIWVGADGDSIWPYGYSANGKVSQSDSTYSFKICDAEWTVSVPWIEGYEHTPTDTTFTIGDLDSSATVDFYYTPIEYLEWVGATGFESDGVDPDTGADGDAFEFGVRYTNAYNDSPYVYEVLIDLNDNLDYEPGERFAMIELDANDTTYSDGKFYTFTTPIDYAGDGVLNYCFYFENQWGGKACGFPNLDNPVVILEPGVEETKIPSITMLYPVAPNPSGGAISIKYGVGISGCDKVSLKVYDVTGRVVRTLVNSKKEPGTYTIKWTGENDAGTKLANGIYFCKFKSGDYQSTRKLILLK